MTFFLGNPISKNKERNILALNRFILALNRFILALNKFI